MEVGGGGWPALIINYKLLTIFQQIYFWKKESLFLKAKAGWSFEESRNVFIKGKTYKRVKKALYKVKVDKIHIWISWKICWPMVISQEMKVELDDECFLLEIALQFPYVYYFFSLLFDKLHLLVTISFYFSYSMQMINVIWPVNVNLNLKP